MSSSERDPLLQRALAEDAHRQAKEDDERRHHTRRALAACACLTLFVVALVVCLGIWEAAADDGGFGDGWGVEAVLKRAPVIDGHIDLPILARFAYANNVSAIELDKEGVVEGHVDIPRLRQGRVGGFFWSVYVDCKPDNSNFTQPSYRVRDTLEQIDVAHLLIQKYPDTFKFATSSEDIYEAIATHKIASMLGVEGAHQIGDSLGVLRQYYALGVRYMTLTHACHNAFADSGGMVTAPEPVHGGLSTIGRSLIYEMNRLGMLVDVSHVSDDTASQALSLSASRGAPVIWSHSSARGLNDISRNVPDSLLRRLTNKEPEFRTLPDLAGRSRSPKEEEHRLREWGDAKTDGVVMVNFAPQFIDENGNADLSKVADHVEYIGRVAGREHVGLGSDFDGIGSTPRGLEDVSKYPDLIRELRSRGWSGRELAGLTGGNLIRVFTRAEEASKEMKKAGAMPALDIYEKRTDI